VVSNDVEPEEKTGKGEVHMKREHEPPDDDETKDIFFKERKIIKR